MPETTVAPIGADRPREQRSTDPGAGAPPAVLFVNHASRLGGAELVLLSVLPAFDARSAVWLFEDGPLRARLAACPVGAVLAPRPTAFAAVKRDRGLARALPLAGDMARMALGIARLARWHQAVYANSQKAFVCGALAATLARRPLVWHLHDILTPAHFGPGQLRLLRSLSRLADRVVVPSQAAAEAFLRLGGDPQRIRVVANGVTLPPDGTERLGRAELRRRLGLPSGFLFGVFSRLSPWKGQEVALRALARLPDAACLIVGDALFGEEDYAAALRRRAREAGLADRVLFLGHRADVPALMRAVDAVVHPSVDPEPFGRTLVEAMLCGTPLVATATGAAGEILADGEAGLLVPPADPEAIARALQAIRADPDAARRRAEAGERRALTRYTEGEMRGRILGVVREAAAPAHLRPRSAPAEGPRPPGTG